MTHLLYMLVGCSVAVNNSASLREASPAAEYTATELKSMLAAHHSGLHSLYVEYRSAPGSYPANEYPEGSYLHCIVAWKSPCFFHQDTAHGHRFLAWEDDPSRSRAFVTRDAWFADRPLSRSYFGGELAPTDPLPGSMPSELIPVATGIWPLVDRPPPRTAGAPLVMIDIAESSDYAQVRPEQELCDGQWCHVLEGPKGSAIWLDANSGCAIKRRVGFHPKTGRFMARIDLSEHEQTLPGVWFPRRITQYRDGEGRDPKGAVEILEVRMNDVPDDLFRFDPPPGSVRFVADRLPEQTVPGGLEHLDHVVSWMRQYVPRGQGGANHAGIIAILLCLGAVLFLETWLRVTRRWHDQQVRRTASRTFDHSA